MTEGIAKISEDFFKAVEEQKTASVSDSPAAAGCMPDADSCEFLNAGWCAAGSHVCEDAIVLENGDVACERCL